MTGKEYCDALELLGLNFTSAAAFLGISEHLSRRIGGGQETLGWVRAALLRVMVVHRISPAAVNQIMSDFTEDNHPCDDNES